MQPPRYFNQTLSTLIERMRDMAPYYTPEWRFTPDDPDPGTALFLIFADMYLDNARRLNRVPMKNFIAFLNMLDVSQLSARPAAGYVTFRLNDGTKEPVMVKKATQLAAKATDGGKDILYETDSTVLLTNANLVDAFQVSATQDVIEHIGDRLPIGRLDVDNPVKLFEFQPGSNLQEHCFYLGHDDFFLIRGAAVIEVDLYHSLARYKQVTYGGRLANLSAVQWQYGTADGWQDFDEVSAVGNSVFLTKRTAQEIAPRDVNGITTRWIRCRIRQTMLDQVSPNKDELVIDSLQIKADYLDIAQTGGLEPDVLFFNDMQLAPAGGYPFGEFFVPYGTFYISSEEALSKRGSLITLRFNLKAIRNRRLDFEPPIEWKLIMKESDVQRPPVQDASVLTVLWEYWNGKSWVRLFDVKEYEELFYKPSEQEADEKILHFICPPDLQPTYVNGNQSYWIRARVLNVENLYANNPYYLSPWVEQVRLGYDCGTSRFPVEAALTNNNLEWVSHTADLAGGSHFFAPFYTVDSRHPALYLGFDSSPLKGPISMYVSVAQQKYTEAERPIVEWEYLRKKGDGTEWATLKVIDGTLGLIKSGTVQFVGPSDFAHGALFRQDHCWIRVVNRDDKWDRQSGGQPVPMVNGVLMNTVRVTQQESVQNETPSQLTDDDVDYWVLSKTPLVAEEVWVDETGRVTEQELAHLQEGDDSLVNAIRDPEGKLLRLWIRWQAVDHFDDSGADDRHYVINRASGKIRFGDGKQGKELPNRGPDKVHAHYKVIGGARGNVEAGQITQLRRSIAFVNGVTNWEPTGGGSDIEPLEMALRRGPQMIKHRGRAVTAEDYEWLARQAHQDIAKVKCLPNRNVNLQRESGAITLVILPRGGQQALHHFPQLKDLVEQQLLTAAPSTVAAVQNVQVIEPAYLEVSILAQLNVRDMDLVVPTEMEALDKLNRFLDPLTGNYDGQGWSIGQGLQQSVFYALLKSIRGVNYIEKLSMTVVKIEDDKRVEIPADRMTSVPHGIIVNGKHTVVVDT